jgi:heme exporter protein A
LPQYSPFNLRASQLALIRGERLLFKRCQFSVGNGDALQIRGANGAGKTSLLRVLCGVLEPDTGELYWNNSPITEVRADFYRNSIYLGHNPGIKERLTVLENLQFYSNLRKTQPSLSFEQAIRQVGLTGFENEYAAYLSQGQKRRVGLARLLLEPVALWILDEPLVALDVDAQDWLASLIDQHLDEGGGVIFTSHQPLNLRHSPQELMLGGLS